MLEAIQLVLIVAAVATVVSYGVAVLIHLLRDTLDRLENKNQQ